MKRWLGLVAVALGLGIFVYAMFFGASEQEIIRKRLRIVVNAVELKASDTNLVLRAARIREAFAEVLTKEVVIEIPELAEAKTGRAEAAQLATSAATMYRTAAIDIDGLSIDVDQEGQSAHVSGKVRVQSTGRSGEPAQDTRTASIRLDKIEGKWRIVSLTVSAKDSPDG